MKNLEIVSSFIAHQLSKRFPDVRKMSSNVDRSALDRFSLLTLAVQSNIEENREGFLAVDREVSTLESYLAFKDNKAVPVSTLHSSTPWHLVVNVAVRYIHDYMHYVEDLPDTIQGEKLVSVATDRFYANFVAHSNLGLVYNDTVRALLLIDSYGQTLHVEYENKQVENQSMFILEVYKHWYAISSNN